MPSQAEQLPTEIWLYIFTFFEGHDLVHAFSHLNLLFDSLLRSPHLQLHIRIKRDESNERLPKLTWSHINLQNIYSLSVGQRKANCLIQFLRRNSQHLIRLRSLSVYLKISTLHNNIQYLIFALQQIPSLNRIYIKCRMLPGVYFLFHPLLMYIFKEKSPVNNCSFIFGRLYSDIITSDWSTNVNLKYLTIRETSWKELFSILSFTPHLYSLKATVESSPVISPIDFTLDQLRKVDLYLHRPAFDQLEIFKQTTPFLQFLRLRGIFDAKNDQFFNESLWQKLFYNVKCYNIDLTSYEYGDEGKRLLKNRIRDYDGKKWLKWDERERSMQMSIVFKSSMT